MTKQISPLRRSMIDHTIFLSVSSGIPGEPMSAAACLAGALTTFRRLERITAFHPIAEVRLRVRDDGRLTQSTQHAALSLCHDAVMFLPRWNF